MPGQEDWVLFKNDIVVGTLRDKKEAKEVLQACNTHATREKLIKDLVAALDGVAVGLCHIVKRDRPDWLLRVDAVLESAKKEMK